MMKRMVYLGSVVMVGCMMGLTMMGMTATVTAQPPSRWHVSEVAHDTAGNMSECAKAVAQGLSQLTPQQAREAKVIATAVGSGGWTYCAVVWEEGR